MNHPGRFEPALLDAAVTQIRKLTPDKEADPAEVRLHAAAICRWLERCFPDEPAACMKRVSELAIAYGLGARRSFSGGCPGPLDGVWSGAIQWLRAELDTAVRRGLELPRAMIPNFANTCPSVYEAVIDLFNWLVFPSIEAELDMGEHIDISSYPDRLEFRGPQGAHKPLYPGQRRTYVLQSGMASAGGPHRSEPLTWLPGSHLITRAGDFSAARVRLLDAGGNAADLPFGLFEFASISASEFCWLEDLSCKCGRDTCSRKHRISAFHPPHLHPKATLKSFVHTAIKGDLPKPTPEAFKGGMLYAWLANRPGHDRIREAPLLRERMVKNPSDQFRPFFDAGDGLVRPADSEAERRRRCSSCGSLEALHSPACGFCGGRDFRPNPVTVWIYQGPREACSLEDLPALFADDGLDMERSLIDREESGSPCGEDGGDDES